MKTSQSNDPYQTDKYLDFTNLKAFPLAHVQLTDPYYCNATQKDITYLLSLDTRKLLAGFYDTAGIAMGGVTRYDGWENLLIGGHTLGHYLTACVNAFTSVNSSKEQKDKLLSIISQSIHGLSDCQEAVGSGFLFGAPILDRNNIELQFDHVERNETNIFTQAWVPWYTMHKIFEGLISVAQMKEKEAKVIAVQARIVAIKLGEWVYHRVSSWSEETKKTVIGIEFGGMNDCLYDLYQLTGDMRFAEAAHAFDQIELFEMVLCGHSGDHVLNNYHANTTIPKFAGALNRYISFEKDDLVEADRYLEYAKAFWDMVVKDHTYITGGNSEWEHFGLDGILDGERTNCNNETCNAYNMLKLTKKLYMITGDVKYANYYETTLINSIMSSQDPLTGMTTYFQPMATGFFKVYGEPTTKFWCCTGSGMENFTKLGESIYYHKDNLILVNQYISSELNFEEAGIVVKQITNIPHTNIADFILESTNGLDSIDLTLALRLPDWLVSPVNIEMGNDNYGYEIIDGYALVKGPFHSGSKLRVVLPMAVKAFSLPDNQNVYGFQYGPVVLSALLGATKMEKSTTGVIVTIPQDKLIETSYTKNGDDEITVTTTSVNEFIQNIQDYLVRDNNSQDLRFILKDTDANLTFVPHFSQHKERYGIYWYMKSQTVSSTLEASQIAKPKKWAETCLDIVQPGYGQYENDVLHNMKEYGEGSVGYTLAGTNRYAKANGAFSYRMIVDIQNGTKLIATFKNEDQGKTLKIRIGNMVVYEHQLHADAAVEEYEVEINLPAHALSDYAETIRINEEERITVTFIFEGATGEASAKLCNFLYSVKA